MTRKNTQESLLKNKLTDFIDALETEFGDLHGVEIMLTHPIVDGIRQEFATVKEVNVMYLTKETIEI